MYSLERRSEREGGRPGVFEEVEADFAGLEEGGGQVRQVCVKRMGRMGGEDLEMDVRMTYGSYEFYCWRGEGVGGGDLDVEFPETG